MYRPKIKQGRIGCVFDFWRRFCNYIFIHKTQKNGMRAAGCDLDRQQIEAVVACENAQLVLASAGSGKTLSLLAKIEYIVEKLKIHPDEILAISFTKKTVDELRERCSVKGVEFRTFHSLGKSILEFNLEKRAKLISEDGIRAFLES